MKQQRKSPKQNDREMFKNKFEVQGFSKYKKYNFLFNTGLLWKWKTDGTTHFYTETCEIKISTTTDDDISSDGPEAEKQ